MALTKVRLPVVDISRVSNGTSQVDIATAGGSIVTSVGGTTAVTYASAGVTVALPLSVTNIDDVENIDLTVASGASATMEAIASALRLWTTSAHPMIIGASSSANLTLETSGKVTLLEQGTASDQLIDKAYVDNSVAGSLASITAEAAASGHISIPNDSGNDIIFNWGTVTGDNDNLLSVTFDEPFPNAPVCAVATRISGSTSLDRSVNVVNVTTTGMDIRNNTNTSTGVYWLAIGF